MGPRHDQTSQARQDAGERLHVLLQRASLTSEQLAHKLNSLAAQMCLSARVDRKTPYKWLRGSTPRDPWPTLVATILNDHLKGEIQPSDIGWKVANAGRLFVPANTGLEAPWDGKGAIDVAAEVAGANAMDRRIFLQLTGTALTQPALEWLLAQPAADIYGTIGRRVNSGHIDSIDEITAQLRLLDDQFGGGAVLDLVKSQVRFVLDLLRNRRYTSTIGRRLHGAAAELLRLAGWVNFDAGQHTAAQRFWIAALHGAHSAGDRSLGANILGFMSCQAKDLGLFGEAIHLAEAAKHGYSGSSQKVVAILNLRTAEAYAQTKDRKRVQAAIDTAYEAFRSADGCGPTWTYWLDEAQVNEQAGYCYTRLNDWNRGQTHLVASIKLQGMSHSREGVVRRALLAVAHAQQGEPEQACALGNRAIDILNEDVDSDRCVGHVRRILDALLPYQKVSTVKGFRDRATNIFGAG